MTKTEDGATGKLSNDIDKEPIPGDTNIEIREGVRYIVQESEEVQGERLLKNVYSEGTLHYDDNDLQAVTDARNQLLKTFDLSKLETRESEKTKKIHAEVRDRLKSNLDEYISIKKFTDFGEEIFGSKEKFASRLQTPHFLL